MTWIHVVTIVISSFVAASTLFIALSRPKRNRRIPHNSLFTETPQDCIFLFDEVDLVDATASARQLLSARQEAGDAWAKFLAYATPRFPDFEERLVDLEDLGRVTLTSANSPRLTLSAEWRGGMTRIALAEGRGERPGTTGETILHRALEDEIAQLRATVDSVPALIWAEDETGAVIWGNRGYLDHLLDPARETTLSAWPLQKLFPELDTAKLLTTGKPSRASLERSGTSDTLWFDCHAQSAGEGRLLFALPADTAVHAEAALRSFIQTLSQTFAHLKIGLAIFDRRRQLVLFNPALGDLTGLAPEFLSTRPTLFSLLDALRERRMIPEPRDYKHWRREMLELEAAAASGQYMDLWSLPGGQTYRVTGQPHPDGAIALLMEDITEEMSVTRSLRAETALGQSVIDTMDEAIAVFSSAGSLLMSNAAYAKLWELEPETQTMGITEASHHWQAFSAPGPFWAKAAKFVVQGQDRAVWSGETRMTDGRLLSCRFVPIKGGATLIGFHPQNPGGPEAKTSAEAGAGQQSDEDRKAACGSGG